jgi:hypothetical protein
LFIIASKDAKAGAKKTIGLANCGANMKPLAFVTDMVLWHPSIREPALDGFCSSARGVEQGFGGIAREVLAIVGMRRVRDFAESTLEKEVILRLKADGEFNRLVGGRRAGFLPTLRSLVQ